MGRFAFLRMRTGERGDFHPKKKDAIHLGNAVELLGMLEQRHPKLLEDCELFSADKGYDATTLITELWDVREIKPVIDIRNLWSEEGQDATRPLTGSLDVV